MSGMLFLVLFLLLLIWVGHACIWTAVLNRIYGCPLPKYFLKGWRYLTDADAPADLGGADGLAELPETMAGELARLALI